MEDNRIIECIERAHYILLPDTEITRQKAAGLLIGRPRKPA